MYLDIYNYLRDYILINYMLYGRVSLIVVIINTIT